MTATTDGYCYIKMVLAARAPDRMHRCAKIPDSLLYGTMCGPSAVLTGLAWLLSGT